VHSHAHRSPHRHLTALKLSESAAPAKLHADPDQRHRHAYRHGGGHGHTHGLVDDSIKRSHEGIRAVLRSLAVLSLAGVAQTIVFVASGSIALLADLIHNFGDALTAVPLGIAFALRSALAERRAGLAVVAAIFISACIAGIEAMSRLVHPGAPTHLPALAFAGAIGKAGIGAQGWGRAGSRGGSVTNGRRIAGARRDRGCLPCLAGVRGTLLPGRSRYVPFSCK